MKDKSEDIKSYVKLMEELILELSDKSILEHFKDIRKISPSACFLMGNSYRVLEKLDERIEKIEDYISNNKKA